MDEISDRDGFDKQTQYPSAKTVAMIMIALYLTCFLVGLVREFAFRKFVDLQTD